MGCLKCHLRVKKKENEQKKSKFQANDDNYKSELKPNQGVNVLLCDIMVLPASPP